MEPKLSTVLESIRSIQSGLTDGKSSAIAISEVHDIILSWNDQSLEDSCRCRADILGSLVAVCRQLTTPVTMEASIERAQLMLPCFELVPSILLFMRSMRKNFGLTKADQIVIHEILETIWSSIVVIPLLLTLSEAYVAFKHRHLETIRGRILDECAKQCSNSDFLVGAIRVCCRFLEISGESKWGAVLRNVYNTISTQDLVHAEFLLEQLFTATSSRSTELLVALLEDACVLHLQPRPSEEPSLMDSICTGDLRLLLLLSRSRRPVSCRDRLNMVFLDGCYSTAEIRVSRAFLVGLGAIAVSNCVQSNNFDSETLANILREVVHETWKDTQWQGREPGSGSVSSGDATRWTAPARACEILSLTSLLAVLPREALLPVLSLFRSSGYQQSLEEMLANVLSSVFTLEPTCRPSFLAAIVESAVFVKEEDCAWHPSVIQGVFQKLESAPSMIQFASRDERIFSSVAAGLASIPSNQTTEALMRLLCSVAGPVDSALFGDLLMLAKKWLVHPAKSRQSLAVTMLGLLLRHACAESKQIEIIRTMKSIFSRSLHLRRMLYESYLELFGAGNSQLTEAVKKFLREAFLDNLNKLFNSREGQRSSQGDEVARQACRTSSYIQRLVLADTEAIVVTEDVFLLLRVCWTIEKSIDPASVSEGVSLIAAQFSAVYPTSRIASHSTGYEINNTFLPGSWMHFMCLLAGFVADGMRLTDGIEGCDKVHCAHIVCCLGILEFLQFCFRESAIEVIEDSSRFQALQSSVFIVGVILDYLISLAAALDESVKTSNPLASVPPRLQHLMSPGYRNQQLLCAATRSPWGSDVRCWSSFTRAAASVLEDGGQKRRPDALDKQQTVCMTRMLQGLTSLCSTSFSKTLDSPGDIRLPPRSLLGLVCQLSYQISLNSFDKSSLSALVKAVFDLFLVCGDVRKEAEVVDALQSASTHLWKTRRMKPKGPLITRKLRIQSIWGKRPIEEESSDSDGAEESGPLTQDSTEEFATLNTLKQRENNSRILDSLSLGLDAVWAEKVSRPDLPSCDEAFIQCTEKSLERKVAEKSSLWLFATRLELLRALASLAKQLDGCLEGADEIFLEISSNLLAAIQNGCTLRVLQAYIEVLREYLPLCSSNSSSREVPPQLQRFLSHFPLKNAAVLVPLLNVLMSDRSPENSISKCNWMLREAVGSLCSGENMSIHPNIADEVAHIVLRRLDRTWQCIVRGNLEESHRSNIARSVACAVFSVFDSNVEAEARAATVAADKPRGACDSAFLGLPEKRKHQLVVLLNKIMLSVVKELEQFFRKNGGKVVKNASIASRENSSSSSSVESTTTTQESSASVQSSPMPDLNSFRAVVEPRTLRSCKVMCMQCLNSTRDENLSSLQRQLRALVENIAKLELLANKLISCDGCIEGQTVLWCSEVSQMSTMQKSQKMVGSTAWDVFNSNDSDSNQELSSDGAENDNVNGSDSDTQERSIFSPDNIFQRRERRRRREQMESSNSQEDFEDFEELERTSKRKQSRGGRRLHSRNPILDDWLMDEDGTDAFADLEGFVVAE